MTECLLKLCAHRAVEGMQCKAPALRKSDYCRHHARVHRPTAILPAYVFAGETASDIRLALLHTIDDLASGQLSPKLGGQILFELDKRIRALKSNSASDSASALGAQHP